MSNNGSVGDHSDQTDFLDMRKRIVSAALYGDLEALWTPEEIEAHGRWEEQYEAKRKERFPDTGPSGFYSLHDILRHSAGKLEEIHHVGLDPTDVSPTLITNSEIENAKFQQLGFKSIRYQDGVEETLAGKSIVLSFRNTAIESKFLIKSFSLKSIDTSSIDFSAPNKLEPVPLSDGPGLKLYGKYEIDVRSILIRQIWKLIEEAAEKRKRLIVVEADAFLDERIPEREVVLQTETGIPIFFRQSLNQIFGWRGVGKSNFCFGVTAALATGGQFLSWKATRAFKVLYIEGEMPASQLQQRQREIIGRTNGNLKLITLDKQQNNTIPSLGTGEGRQLVEEVLGDTEILVLDSVSTLFGVGMNDEENLLETQSWLMRLRSRGLCVILLHHAGKGGLQRGHSRWEDPLDLSIKLSHPQDYDNRQGFRVELTFDKTRGVVMAEGKLEITMKTENGRAIFVAADSENLEYLRACEMFEAGDSLLTVARQLGIGKTTAHRWKQRWGASKEGQMEEGPF